MASKNFTKLRNSVMLAALTAIVLLLQLAGVTIRLGATNISLVLIPIVFGAVTLGPSAGAWLGLVFGLETFIVSGVMGGDPFFTAILFNNAPVMTALICIVKGTAAGLMAGIVYRLVCGKSKLGALICAAATAPIVNTGGFAISNVLAEQFANGMGVSVVYFLIVLCAGWNFVFEFILNLVVVPTLGKLIDVVTRSAYSKK